MVHLFQFEEVSFNSSELLRGVSTLSSELLEGDSFKSYEKFSEVVKKVFEHVERVLMRTISRKSTITFDLGVCFATSLYCWKGIS
jgi:hypothetical protein